MAASAIGVRRIAGGNLISAKPFISNDSKYIICAVFRNVFVYSTETGEIVRKLFGHENEVIAICENFRNKFQVVTVDSAGFIFIWNYEDGMAVKRITTNIEDVCFAHCHPSLPSLFFVGCKTNKAQVAVALEVQWELNGNVSVKDLYLKHVSQSGVCFAIDHKGQYLLYVKHEAFTIVERASNRCYWFERTCYGKRLESFVCIAAHPSQAVAATGCKNGRIYLWYYDSVSKPVSTCFHWHTSISDLCFTAEGGFLLSGGIEGVLVRWRPDTARKELRPRLGGPIQWVHSSKDNTLYATCHLENCIQLLNTSFTVKQIIAEFTLPYLSKQRRRILNTVGLHYDPVTGAVLTNGKPGHVQFYQPRTRKMLFNLDIVCQNFISPSDEDLVYTELSLVALSADGRWLATVEQRNDGVTTLEHRLKFWGFNDVKQEFELNTKVVSPHDQSVTQVRFRPIGATTDDAPMVVTCSADGTFKAWRLEGDATKQRWLCAHRAYFRSDMAATDCDMAEDGSLLAVIYGNFIAFWAVPQCVFKTYLAEPCQHAFSQVCFGRTRARHLLVTASSNAVHIWNLLTFTPVAQLLLSITHLAANPWSHEIALVTKRNLLAVLDPCLGQVVVTLPNPPSTSAVMAVMFYPRHEQRHSSSPELGWLNRAKLMVLDQRGSLHAVDEKFEQDEGDDDAAPAWSTMTRRMPENPIMNALLHPVRKRGAGLDADDDERVKSRHDAARKKLLDEMLATPAHCLPAMRTLCDFFLSAMLSTKSAQKDTTLSLSDTREEDDDDAARTALHREEDADDVDLEHPDESAIDVSAMDTTTAPPALDTSFVSKEYLQSLLDLQLVL